MSDAEHDELVKQRDQYAKAVATLSSRFDEKVEELSFVRMVSDALARCTTAENICKAIVRLIQETLAPENCSVFTVEEREILLRAAMGAFDDEPAFLGSRLFIFYWSGFIGHSVEAGRTLRLSTARDDPRFEDRKDGTVTPSSILVVPLIFDERVIGVINLSDSAHGIWNRGMRDCL